MGNTGNCTNCLVEENSALMGCSFDYLTLREYKILRDRNVQRSGEYWYKSNVAKSCCRRLEINLEIEKYVQRSSHEKKWKKWLRFLSSDQE